MYYGNWGVVAWLNKEPLTAADHANNSRATPLPAPPEVVASCHKVLTVWADPDAEAKHDKEWAHYVNQLQVAFGLVIWDYDNNAWWEPGRRTNG